MRQLDVRRTVAALRTREREEGVAMLAALLMIMILGSLSILVLGLVLSQSMPTQFARKNTRTIFAAESGVEATLAEIRTAANAPDFTGTVYGSLSKLPCTLTGRVVDASGELTYSVNIRYFKDNPAGQSEAWRSSKKMTCTPGSGLMSQPGYALVESLGDAPGVAHMSGDVAERTLATIYRFQTTNTNVAGGRIYTFGDQYCLRADGIVAGSTVTYVPKDQCGTDDEKELWLYDTTYQIKLASTVSPGVTALCVTGPPNGSSTSPALTKLQNCESTTSSARWNQLFSWEGGSRWRGENSTITDYSSWCLGAGTTGDPNGRKLYVSTTCASDQAWGSFNPDPAVGAGAASVATIQIVNFLEFGRCFDVTDQDVNKAYMIAYPCKQDPSGGAKLNWNHKWYYQEPTPGNTSNGPQQIYIYQNNSTSAKYCLQAPASGGQYVTLTSACSTSANNQKWTRYQDTGNYATGYTFVDYLGRCVSIGDKYNGSWSKIVVTACTGGPDQKWNAPPDKVDASVGDYLETYG